jgi:Ca2+-binding RTX toxin-like protein
MKKLLLISLVLWAFPMAAIAHAEKTYTVLLAGGDEDNKIKVWLSADGRQYVIDSVVQLEIGGTVCAHPEDNPNELICDAPTIAGFEVNAGGGDDHVQVAKHVAVPVTMRGGPGDDLLLGGAGTDKLIGGRGDDRLIGWRGDDLLNGGSGADLLVGNPGSDVLRGGLGMDMLAGGPGADDLFQ